MAYKIWFYYRGDLLMAKKIWRPLNTWGLVLIGFCCGVVITYSIAVL